MLVRGNTQVPRPCIQGLSDLIFGLALYIGAIQLITAQSLPQDTAQRAAIIGVFGFSFLILINIWNRYTIVMSAMPVETGALVRLNMMLLFLVVIEPYLSNLMYIQGLGSPIAQQVSSYYAADVGAMNLTLACFTHTLTVEERNLVPKELIGRFRWSRNALLAGSALFFFSDLPAWWTLHDMGDPARVLVWILAVPVSWLNRIYGGRGRRSDASEPDKVAGAVPA